MDIEEYRLALQARLDRVEAADLAGEIERGALVVDTRPVEQRERDGALPGAVVIDRNVLEWRLDLREGPDEPQLLLLALRLFTASGVAAVFSLEPQQLLGCFVELRGTYLPNSFHNWRHAMMVTHEAFQPRPPTHNP